jgi:hypothetical protein
MDTVTQLASDMRVYQPHHILVGSYLYETWDPHLIKQLLSLLSPDRPGMRIDVQTSDFGSLHHQFKSTFKACSLPLLPVR